MRDPVISPGLEHYNLTDSSQSVDFEGYHLGHVSTERDSSPRWTIMDLYKIHEPQTDARYVLDIQGRSVLYHSSDGNCNTGTPTPVSLLPQDAEPCGKCLPRGVVGDPDTWVEMEINQREITPCITPADVVKCLRGTRGGQQLSRPAQRLLASAMVADDAFDPTNIVSHL